MDNDNGKENTNIITSPTGGKREKVGVRFDLIPYEALYEIAKVFAYGAEKYADNNWKGLDFQSGEQTPLNHALMHLSQAASMPFGTLERRWQLAKAAVNVAMQIWGEVHFYDGQCNLKQVPLQPDTPKDKPPILGPFKGVFGSKK